MSDESSNVSAAPAFDAKNFLAQQSGEPGVYQMYDQGENILYVGKAKNLKKRLSSYFQKTNQSLKTRSLVEKICRIDVTVTHTETEALLLEQNLIKQQRPPYNILLRDDKSYPYIFVSTEDEYPRLAFHRGPKRKKGRYFGPFPSSSSVRESLSFLQKTFQVRQCEDSFFKNRSRPCLQHQIQRCTAPCVKAISTEEYAEDLRHTMMFLEGKEQKVSKELVTQMEEASAQLEFEKAARLRDQIASLRRIQEQQIIEDDHGDADVLAIAVEHNHICVQVVNVRQGRILASRSYFPSNKLGLETAEALAAFIPQYYLNAFERGIPSSIIINQSLGDEQSSIEEALCEVAGRKVQLSHKVRGPRAKWQQMASRTAQQNLSTRVASKQSVQKRLEELREVLGMDEVPERMECFDISHSSGEATVASCVVFDKEGPKKSDYRRFNIEGIQGGDDFAAMKQALTRRYTRIQEGEGKLPDILFIDGGKGQLTQAESVLEELQVQGVRLVAIAKGTTRKPGFETLIIVEESEDSEQRRVEKVLPSTSPALHWIQQIRDEAHRFAITGHKQRRDKKRNQSVLEGIPGVGPKKRKDLLQFFGGQQEIARAGVDDLMRVKGISRSLAQQIYDTYHPQ